MPAYLVPLFFNLQDYAGAAVAPPDIRLDEIMNLQNAQKLLADAIMRTEIGPGSRGPAA